MMKNQISLAALIVTAMSLLSCGAPFRCFDERIEVSLPATIVRETTQESQTLFDAVAVGNVGQEFFTSIPIRGETSFRFVRENVPCT